MDTQGQSPAPEPDAGIEATATGGEPVPDGAGSPRQYEDELGRTMVEIGPGRFVNSVSLRALKNLEAK